MKLGGANETGIRLIPPVVFLAALVVAWAAEALLPTTTGLPTGPARIVAVAAIAASVAFVLWLFLRFRARGTACDVTERPKVLVTDGAFAISRNPGYVAMVVGTLAFAPLFDTLWVLPATFVAAAVIDVRVVRREEALLEETFGEAYRRYRERVRRWL